MKDKKGIAVSCIGSSHIKCGKECQDRSKYITGKRYSAVVVCDGHGGDKHFRSAIGAELAIKVFEKAITEFADKYHSLLKKSKLDIVLRNFEKHLIFSWREAVTEHYNVNPFLPDEIERFDETVIEELRENYHITYGSTFLCCFAIKEELFVIQLGDGEIRLLINNEQTVSPIPHDDNLMFGITTSLCNADAIQYVKDCRTKIGDISACVMCSDGVRNSFDTEEHFNGFCKTLANAFANDTENTFEQDMQTFLSELTANGSGDDVSVGIITV